MRSTIHFTLLMISLIGLGCTASNDTDSSEVNVKTEEALDTSGFYVTANYESAAVYAGMTEYSFRIVVTTGNFGEEPQVSMPEQMLESTEGDVPGANPEMLYKDFRIYFGADQRVTKITLAE